MSQKLANKLFAEAFHVGMARRATVTAFRRVAQLGLPYATPLVHQEGTQFAQELFTSPEYDKLFLDKEKVIELEGGVAGMGKTIAEGQIKKFRSSVDAASLVFAHSVLDSQAMDYCRITALVAPERWEEFVSNRKLSLAEVRGRSYEELLGLKVEACVDELSRESLLKKSDRLFQICRPAVDFDPLRDYEFDRDRLERLDTYRHDVIHGRADPEPLQNAEDEIWFLFQTGLYYMGLVNHAFDVRIDPRDIYPKTPA